MNLLIEYENTIATNLSETSEKYPQWSTKAIQALLSSPAMYVWSWFILIDFHQNNTPQDIECLRIAWSSIKADITKTSQKWNSVALLSIFFLF